MNSRSCAICSGDSASQVFDQAMHSIAGIGDIGYHHKIHVCDQCGFVFASPLLADAQILRYYEFFSNYEQHQSGGKLPDESKAMVQRQVDLLTARFQPGYRGRALDIGCSLPYALSLLKEQGWSVRGLDPSDWCIQKAKELYGVEVHKGFISPEMSKSQGPVDAIILSHVLEHLVYPHQALAIIRDTLADDGVLYIEVPNLMDNNHLTGYFTFEHVNFFTPTSLTNLARSSGFEIETLSLFDNAQYKSAYPVIAATLRKTSHTFELVNDAEPARRVIEEYKRAVESIVDRLNRRIGHAVSQTAPDRLAVWGAGIHTSQLMSDTHLARTSLRCIYDNDVKKVGHCLNGVPIKAFPADPQLAKQEIDAILISSQASEDEIHAQLLPLEQHGIRIYRLYGPQAE